MSIEHLSIYFCLPFLSSVSYSFQCTGLSLPWLSTLLGIFILFDVITKEIIFFISLSDSLLIA